ncbi:DUF58 domain-containing protein [Bacillus sp. CGMCC 1.16607]|uniref:DUF58 domain-containing protein n=1 Tax=Bacillus sp. CGMCC 1.16607 TaxID=3351842 RepID=UPI003636608C
MKKVIALIQFPWKLLILLLLLVLTYSYAMFQGGFVSWFLFFSFLPFAVLSLAVSFYSLKDLKVERFFTKTDYYAGETLKVQIKLKRNFRFPLFYLVVEDVLTDRLQSGFQLNKSKVLLIPGFRKEFSFEYVVESLPRGEHFFQEVRLKTGDLLGLIEKEYVVAVDHQIIVYPAYTEMIYRPFENQYDQGMTASRERVQRDTSMAIGVREYQPGDRFSWINWKATAKRNDIMTKEFEQRQSHDLLVVPDCVQDTHFEMIVSFTASLVRAILRKGAQVGLISYDKERASFAIRGGESQQQQLFYHLAKIEDRSAISLDRVLEAEGLLTGQNASILLVTAQLTKNLLEKVSFLSLRKGTIVIFLMKETKESLSSNELSLKSMANARGIRVVMVHEGQFANAFSEVSR